MLKKIAYWFITPFVWASMMIILTIPILIYYILYVIYRIVIGILFLLLILVLSPFLLIIWIRTIFE